MADHIISLSAKREEALQKILDRINNLGSEPGTKTKDDLLRDWCLHPILEQIRADRALNSESLQTAYEAATQEVKDQVDALLGINIP
jgi:hypothetical protein